MFTSLESGVPASSPCRPASEAWRAVAAELSTMTRYYDRAIEWRGAAADEGALLNWIDCPLKLTAACLDDLPDLRAEPTKRTLIILRRAAFDDAAGERLLRDLLPCATRTTRVALVGRGGSARTPPVAGWQVVRTRPAGYLARRWGGLGPLANRWLPALPLFQRLSAESIAVLRPIVPEPFDRRPSLTVIVPARNEQGNIGHVLPRLPHLDGASVEVIFVEGHSTDGTWAEIERVVAEPGGSAPAAALTVRALRQPGRGKADAVRAGLAAAKGDLVTILDADLTMPPESLAEFYAAYCRGEGDFVNGDRLSLPMEPGAMRPLNKLGNRFFAWALSQACDVSWADCLCGTKLFARHDCLRFASWRGDFGERDPFGDFDLLFPAAALALGCVNIPVRYAARTYGQTNIHRFRDGARLLAMTLAGWWHLKAGKIE